MTEEINLGGMVCLGHTKVAWLPNLTRYPHVTMDDFTAAGAMNASFFMMQGFGLFFDDGRWQVRDCRYVVDPQDTESGLAALMKPGESGYFAFRYGPDVTVDWSPIQTVNLVPCVLGPRFIAASDPDEFAQFVFSQQVFVSGKPLIGAEIGAARAVAA